MSPPFFLPEILESQCFVRLSLLFLRCVFFWKSPLENLEPILREDIQKVKVVALSSYEEKEEQFKEHVANLRQRFHHSIAPGGIAGYRRVVVPTSGFSYSAQQIWKIIKENKDLDLPAHKVMVATARCEEIDNERFSNFRGNQDWCELEEAAQNEHVKGFGKKLSLILGSCLSEPEMVVGWYHSHNGFGCWLSAVDINTQQVVFCKAKGILHPSCTGVVLCGRKQMTEEVTKIMVEDGVSSDRILKNF